MSVATNYSVQCACGREVSVCKADAGGEVGCSCGQRVNVPRLSALRAAVGEEAYARSTIERIRRMIAAGELPPEPYCLVSFRPTTDVLPVTVECETPCGWQYSWWMLSLIACVSMALYRRALRDETDVKGREIVVELPMRIAADCQAYVRRFGQSKLRELLSTVPIYAQLLQEYPDARLSVR
jgi:hypothetical protein